MAARLAPRDCKIILESKYPILLDLLLRTMNPAHQTIRRPLAAWLLCCGVAVAQAPTEEEAIEAPITNPAVRAVLDTPRKAPADYARAVFVLIDLDEAARAAPIVEELIALDLDEGALAELVTQFGSAKFLKLARSEAAGAGARDFATGALAAAKAQLADPQRLAKLVAQLGSESPRLQAAALAELQRGGQAAVGYCLNQFAQATEGTDRNSLREALVALGPLSRPALVAMLQSSEADLRKQAAWALGQQQDYRAAPLLAAQAVTEPSGSDAARAAQWAFRQLTDQPASTALALKLLDGALRDVHGGVPPETPDAQGMAPVYRRDADAALATEATMMPVEDAGIVYAARLARARYLVDPSSTRAKRSALVLDLQARSLFEAAEIAPPDTQGLAIKNTPTQELSGALGEALERGYAGAAAALGVAVGDRGEAAILITADSRPSPLVAALEAPHPAVRFAALRGVMGLKSATPFPGSSNVADTLIGFAGGGAARVAVVATPNLERSATIAGFLASAGIEGRPTNRGAEAVELAQSADVEMVLVDLAVLRPDVRETIFRLRRQTTTALAPIGLLAPAGRLEEAKALAKEHDRVLAFPRPQNAAAVEAIVNALAAVTPAGWPTVDERAELAKVARGWMGEILEKGPTYYDLRGHVGDLQKALVSGPGEATASLALLGTPASQLELLAIANRRTEPLDSRQTAAKAFKQSVDEFGVLLTTEQIQQQYDSYNASEADAETQEVLGNVLDAIESRRSEQSAGGRRQ